MQALEIFVNAKDNHSYGITVRSLSRLWEACQDESIPARVATVLGVEVSDVEGLLRGA